MKLFYSPGACSLAPHIALSESGLAYTTKIVDLKKHALADGTDYYTVNPKGYVPLLELDDGSRLSEVAVILQYIADRKPGSLAPVFGTMDRYRVMEWLNFVATEIHKGFGPLWYPDTPAATREKALATLGKRFATVEAALGRHRHVGGDTFGIVDAYLYTVLSWAKLLKVDLAAWPRIVDYLARVGERPSVRATKTTEAAPAKTAEAATAK
jgi:glutathione S-transferase